MYKRQVEQILYALHCVIAENRCDILIIARGGGASETLAVFNEDVYKRQKGQFVFIF